MLGSAFLFLHGHHKQWASLWPSLSECVYPVSDGEASRFAGFIEGVDSGLRKGGII